MKHIKIFEQYTIDLDNGEIPEEYAKMIISKFILIIYELLLH
jgi:hypothetical protein